MRSLGIAALLLCACTRATPAVLPVVEHLEGQNILGDSRGGETHVYATDGQPPGTVRPKRLQGRFLHISDLHPDQFYKLHSSTEEDIACHRGVGPAGKYGAETSDCDSPLSLVDATFEWIKENVVDKVDFVIWTGDSARHDSDEQIPRTAKQILETNTYIAEKFAEVFGNGGANHNPTDMAVPVVPTFGNNDILPHNILLAGPNKWLNTYLSVWRKFIPEPQRHSFGRGGWFYIEVIPNKLAVFSLNTMYFFDRNAGVDGCAKRDEPGWEHMEWLRIQLDMLRARGMKAILSGHVGPARTDSKKLWDETCWQRYTLWLRQYRDVVVTGIFGHMNIDHFMIQDTEEVDILSYHGLAEDMREFMGDELTIQSAGDYLEELRTEWSDLPDPRVLNTPPPQEDTNGGKKKHRKKKPTEEEKRRKALKKFGGEFGERYQVTIVGPSVVPNYFPTLRIMEYNITGLDHSNTFAAANAAKAQEAESEDFDAYDEMNTFEAFTQHAKDEALPVYAGLEDPETPENTEAYVAAVTKRKKHKKKKDPKPTDPDLHIPSPPAPDAPPGPAYSPQPFTLMGYTQYYANLTEINDDMTDAEDDVVSSAAPVPHPHGVVSEEGGVMGWHPGKNKGKMPKKPGDPHTAKFHYEVLYSTFNDTKGYKLDDLTVKSYLGLAYRIGRYKAGKNDIPATHDHPIPGDYDRWTTLGKLRDAADFYLDSVKNLVSGERDDDLEADAEIEGEEYDSDAIEPRKKRRAHRKKHNRKKNKHGSNRNRAWRTFIRRAFVGTLDDEDVDKFEVKVQEGTLGQAKERGREEL